MFDVRKRKPPMRVDVAALRQQAWRAEKLFTDFARYAKSVGCTFGEGAMCDEIIANDKQAKLIAKWWTENCNG